MLVSFLFLTSLSDGIAGFNTSTSYYPGKYSLPRHNTVADLPADGTGGMALFAYLGYLQYHFITGSYSGADRTSVTSRIEGNDY